MEKMIEDMIKSRKMEMNPNEYKEVIKEMKDEVVVEIEKLIRMSKILMRKANKVKLTSKEVEMAMRLNQYEFGTSKSVFSGAMTMPHTITRKGLHFVSLLSMSNSSSDKLIDFNHMLKQEPVALPEKLKIHAHWLGIAGTMPELNENDMDTVKKYKERLGLVADNTNTNTNTNNSTTEHKENKENVLAKINTVWPMTVEKQVYFKEVTETLISGNEEKRRDTLNFLLEDVSVSEFLPNLVMFVNETIKVNVATGNLMNLLYMLEALRMLVCNAKIKNSAFVPYLNVLVPRLTDLIAVKDLSAKVPIESQWSLREFAVRVLVFLLQKFESSVPEIRAKTSATFVALLDKVMQTLNDEGESKSSESLSKVASAVPYCSVYGLLMAIGSLAGEDEHLTHIKQVSRRLSAIISQSLQETEKTIGEETRAQMDYLVRYMVMHAGRLMEKASETSRRPESVLAEFGPIIGQLVLDAIKTG